jgi:hypothetical protein
MLIARLFIGYGSMKLSFSHDGRILSTGSTLNGMDTQSSWVVLLLDVANAINV